MFYYTDMMGATISLLKTPKRIVSLVPSQTELLFDLGLDEEVKGITKFCIHPQSWSITKTKVGGTKNVHLEKVILLKPELIIANKEENNKEQINRLKEIAPVWVSDVKTLDDAYKMMHEVGKIVGKEEKAINIIQQIKHSFKSIQLSISQNALYLIWRNPWMSAGADTFINEMMQQFGFKNVLANKKRYPTLTDDLIIELNPDIVLLSSEPFPFQKKHIDELRKLVPKSTIILVDGTIFSWYGSHLLLAPSYYSSLIKMLHNQLKK